MLTLVHPVGSWSPISQDFLHRRKAYDNRYLYPDGSMSWTPDPSAKQGRFHEGLDLGVSEGTALYAAGAGVVVFSGWDATGYGYRIDVEITGQGIKVLLGHCSLLLIPRGQTVTAGQLIAYSGNTGNSTAPHTHFSVIRVSDGHYIDPAQFLLD